MNAGIKCYVICDLGDGTADIACHEIDENERPVVGRGGSTYVDQHFCALLDDKYIHAQIWIENMHIGNMYGVSEAVSSLLWILFALFFMFVCLY